MKTAHIISHSHWDREWYLPYETHHMLLIEFMDTLIETLEKDLEYKSFHLDGQTLLIEDYLEVRPENRQRLHDLIQAKRIHVGPWFILQDEFLTSSEANIRNLQVGHKIAREYGEVCKVGYFPDSFGNMGQAPQILKKAGIETAVFGRGVKPTGFNNQVADSESYESPYSEMYWESGDGSSVLAILFANWYSNGIEIPQNEEEAKAYWEVKLPEAKKYASTSHLLYMNGCDHQPVQVDLAKALETARKLYPEVEFVHSNFEEYIEVVRKELPEDMTTIKGELRSQKTEGWYTLANTASARIYIKQMNTRCQMLFEKIAEPIATIAYKEGKAYPHHLLTYGWKLLMENHPHDSICGCSVDDVHREMVTRFEKAENVAHHIIKESLTYLEGKIDTSSFKTISDTAKPFIVVNTTGWDRSGVVEVELEIAKKYFREAAVPNVVRDMHEMHIPSYKIVNKQGQEVPGVVEEMPNVFNYDLPKDKFRQPYIAKKVKVTLEAKNLPAFGWDTFALVEDISPIEEVKTLIAASGVIETPYLKVHIEEDGSLSVFDKQSNQTFSNLGIYEDCGDIGNEYIYFMPVNDTPITTKGLSAHVEVVEDTPYRAVVKVIHNLMIPGSANEVLDKEIKDLVEFKERKAARGNKLIPMTIETYYTFERASRGIKVRTVFNNEALDHRLRVLFETNIQSDYHYADSIFEVAKRDTVPSKEWKNPCNAQHQQAFVNVHNEKCGLTIANKGLNEYEVLRDGKNTVALTLHRGVRELGDWGVFLTPEAQCLGHREVEFEIIPHGADEDVYASYQEAYGYQVDWLVKGCEIRKGELPQNYQLFEAKHKRTIPSTLKVSETTGDIVTRWYNVADEEDELIFKNQDIQCYETDLLEEAHLKNVPNKIKLGKKEILTLGVQFI